MSDDMEVFLQKHYTESEYRDIYHDLSRYFGSLWNVIYKKDIQTYGVKFNLSKMVKNSEFLRKWKMNVYSTSGDRCTEFDNFSIISRKLQGGPNEPYNFYFYKGTRATSPKIFRYKFANSHFDEDLNITYRVLPNGKATNIKFLLESDVYNLNIDLIDYDLLVKPRKL